MFACWLGWCHLTRPAPNHHGVMEAARLASPISEQVPPTSLVSASGPCEGWIVQLHGRTWWLSCQTSGCCPHHATKPRVVRHAPRHCCTQGTLDRRGSKAHHDVSASTTTNGDMHSTIGNGVVGNKSPPRTLQIGPWGQAGETKPSSAHAWVPYGCAPPRRVASVFGRTLSLCHEVSNPSLN